MKLLGNIFYGIFILLLVGVAGLFLLSILPASITGPLGGLEIKIVKSGSMEPAIPTGSIVLVRPADVYKVGDIVTFGEDTTNQIPTTHRIMEVTEENGATFYSTKGDANEEADPILIAKTEVIGKILTHVPYAGYVIDFARQPIGFTLMIGIPAGIIILDELIRVVMEIKAMRRRKDVVVTDVEPVLAHKRVQYFDMPPERPKAVVNIRSFDIPRPEQENNS